MKIDRNTLKKLLEQSKPNETLVLTVDSLEKSQDYVIVTIQR